MIFNRSTKAKIYLLIQGEPGENGCEVVTNAVGDNEFTNYEDFKYAVENKLTRNMNTSCLLSDSIKYVNDKIDNSNTVFVFSFFDQNNIFYREADGYEVLNNLNRSIDISLVSKITEDRRKGYAMDLLSKSGANSLFAEYKCSNEILNHIYGAVPDVDSSYPIISADGLYRIKLDAPITYKYIQAANGEITDFTGFADTDKDGLYDFREIDCLSDLIEVDYNKNVKLPTFGQCIKAKGKELFYVDSGLERFKKYLENDEPDSPEHRIDILINQTQVLPIISDPAEKDGDNDGILDIYDGNPLHDDRIPELFVSYINQKIIPFESVITSDAGVTICTVPLSEMEGAAKFVPFNYYDESGKEIYVEEENEVEISKEAMSIWHLMAIEEDDEIRYTIFSTAKETSESKLEEIIDKIALAVKKSIEDKKLAVQTIKGSFEENGTWETFKTLGDGMMSVYVSRIYFGLGNFANVGNMISSALSGGVIKYNDHLSIKEGEYLQWELANYDVNDPVYQSAKALTYWGYTIKDGLTMVNGTMIAGGGVGIAVAGDAISVAGIPVSGGASLAIAVPATAVGTVVTATGAAVAASGVMMFSSDKNGYDKAIQQVKNTIKKLKYKPTSGVEIKSTPGKTTTILGRFSEDTKEILKELNYPKSTDFEAKPGDFNMLNTPDEYFQQLGEEGFWNKYNKPFLDKAIERGDVFVMATRPTDKTMYTYENGTKKLTGFGKEYFYLQSKGYIYDEQLSIMKKVWWAK